MMLRAYIRLVVYIILVSVILFFSAGRIDWLAAWVFLVIYTAIIIIGVTFVDPELLKERSKIGPGAKRWDIVIASVAVVFLFPATFLVAGLDAGRYHWSPPFPVWLQIAAFLGFLAGSALQSWAIITNKFYSSVVRIQTDRGHYVITDGPYRYVRHPGYTGVIVTSFAIPLMLGSLWALVPALIGDCILVIRTLLEDNTLKSELAGYTEYAAKTHYRLIPGIW